MSTTTTHQISQDFTVTERQYRGSGAILPGHLVEPTTTANQIRVHSTSGGSMAVLIALEDQGVGGKISTPYATGANVRVGAFCTGKRFYGRIQNGQTVAISAKLESAGDGTFKVLSTDLPSYQELNSVRVWAVEACDMSGSSGADPVGGLCLLEVM
jgi:hypothetical protein